MRRHSLLHGVVGALVVVLGVLAASTVGVARAGPTGDVTATVGQAVTLDGEQIHTVVRTERWYGGGFWFPKVGEAAVTVQIRVQALAKTSHNSMYYAIRDGSGAQHGRAILGYRYPSLPSSASAPAGTTVEGWLTFVVPAAKVGDLTLEYHMHGGFGSTLRVPLGVVPDSPRVPLGATATVGGEQAHTVSAAGVWPGRGMWKPKTGYVYVTWKVRVKALAPTTIGGMYYSLRAASGQFYRGSVLGSREPRLPYKAALASGRTAQGWVTQMVPKGKVAGLTIVYHLHDSGPNLLVPFTARAT